MVVELVDREVIFLITFFQVIATVDHEVVAGDSLPPPVLFHKIKCTS